MLIPVDNMNVGVAPIADVWKRINVVRVSIDQMEMTMAVVVVAFVEKACNVLPVEMPVNESVAVTSKKMKHKDTNINILTMQKKGERIPRSFFALYHCKRIYEICDVSFDRDRHKFSAV